MNWCSSKYAPRTDILCALYFPTYQPSVEHQSHKLRTRSHLSVNILNRKFRMCAFVNMLYAPWISIMCSARTDPLETR